MNKPHVFDASPHGSPYLASRAYARYARHALEYHTAKTPADHDIVIDLTDVQAMTYPYTDELLGNYLANVANQVAPTTAVLLTGLNDDTRETIEVCLQARSIFSAELRNGHVGLLGANPQFHRTYGVAATFDTFRAGQLAHHMRASPSNINNRLKRMVGFRTLRQHRTHPAGGGREFIYAVPTKGNPALPQA